GGVEGLIQGNNKTILVKLLSAETEIEQETIYSLFLRILDKNSHKGIIICHALVGEKVANLAELYDIQIIVLEKPAEMERSIRETLYQVFR
ncbi:MAG: hypothetical protein ACE5KG_07495, partial [Nitrososphaerales archaeon]